MKKTINCGINLINKANNCCTNNISEYHVQATWDMEMSELPEASGMENKEFFNNETRQEMHEM